MRMVPFYEAGNNLQDWPPSQPKLILDSKAFGLTTEAPPQAGPAVAQPVEF